STGTPISVAMRGIRPMITNSVVPMLKPPSARASSARRRRAGEGDAVINQARWKSGGGQRECRSAAHWEARDYDAAPGGKEPGRGLGGRWRCAIASPRGQVRAFAGAGCCRVAAELAREHCPRHCMLTVARAEFPAGAGNMVNGGAVTDAEHSANFGIG